MNVRAAIDGRGNIYGEGAPLPGPGRIGDIYIDTVANLEYGPKTAAGWGTGRSRVGPRGIDGWTRITRYVTRDDDVVEEVIDWVGGEGTKPAVNVYIGGASATGYVENIIDAANVRGPAGTLSNIDDLTDAGAVDFADGAPITQDGTAKRTTAGAIAAMGLLSFDNKAQAEGKSIPTTLVKTIFLRAYEDIGDGGRAHYKLVGAEPAHDLWIQTADGAFWEIDEPFVTPQMGGAKADGETDDSAAIQRADAVGRAVFFPPGVYAANGLSQTVSWDMHPTAKILYNGEEYGECVRNSSNGIRSGTIYIDGDGLEPRTVFYLEGDRNYYEGVFVNNVISSDQLWANRCIYVTGDYNVIVHSSGIDLVNTGNDNDSSPQCLTTHETADGNVFHTVYGKNVRSVVVNAGTGANTYGNVTGVDCRDNGFYSVEGLASVASVSYDGDDNALGFRHGAHAEIGTLNVLRSGSTSVFFGDCGDITIDSIIVHDNAAAIMQLNLAAAGEIKIGSIKGSLRNTLALYMAAVDGYAKYLTIGRIDLTVYVDDLGAFSQASFMKLDGVRGFAFGEINIKVVLEGISGTAFFYCDLANPLTYQSYLGKMRVSMFDADRVTRHATCSWFCRYVGQQLLLLEEGYLTTAPYVTQANDSLTRNRHGLLVASAVPVAGFWRRGTVIYKEAPSAGNVMFICTAAGTPGTWITQ